MKNLLKLILISLSFYVFPNDLLSIYEEALDKDPEFNSKKADLAISKEFLNQSRSGLMPQLRVTGGTNWNEYYQERELQNSYNTFSFGLNLSQPLFRLDKWFLNRQAKENLEAAEEIARQLRLRDIGGIIVIDFIDMESQKKQQNLLNKFKYELAKDKTRTQVFEISRLGLVEMTRKNVAAGLIESFSNECEKCNGRGLIISDIFSNKTIDEDLLDTEAIVE